MTRQSILLATLVALSQVFMLPSVAAAQVDDFFRGKTITIIIPIGPGGAYDAYARGNLTPAPRTGRGSSDHSRLVSLPNMAWIFSNRRWNSTGLVS